MRLSLLLLVLTISTGLHFLLCNVAFAEDEKDKENPYLVTNAVSSIAQEQEQEQFFRRAVHFYQAAVHGPPPPIPKTQLGRILLTQVLIHGFGLASERIVEGASNIPQLSVLREHSPMGYLVGMAAGGLVGLMYLRHPNMEDVVAYLVRGRKKGYFIDREQYAKLAAQMPAEECETALRALIKD